MLNLTRLHLGIAHESQFQGLGIRSFIVDLCLWYERQHLRNQSNSSLDGAPPLQARSSCQNSKSNTQTPEMAPRTPATAFATSSWPCGGWPMLSLPPRETRRSRPTIWAMSRSFWGKVICPELSNGNMSLNRSDLGCLQTS